MLIPSLRKYVSLAEISQRAFIANLYGQIMKKFLFTLTAFFFLQVTLGQTTSFTVFQIDSIVKHIDSTCISGGITDYTLNKKGQKKKVIGGGADWFYTDTSGKKLLKAIREISLESETFDTYYFHQDSLIYLKTTNASYKGDKKNINWTRECYFTNTSLILKQDNINIAFDPKIFLKTARAFFIGDQIWKRH